MVGMTQNKKGEDCRVVKCRMCPAGHGELMSVRGNTSSMLHHLTATHPDQLSDVPSPPSTSRKRATTADSSSAIVALRDSFPQWFVDRCVSPQLLSIVSVIIPLFCFTTSSFVVPNYACIHRVIMRLYAYQH